VTSTCSFEALLLSRTDPLGRPEQKSRQLALAFNPILIYDAVPRIHYGLQAEQLLPLESEDDVRLPIFRATRRRTVLEDTADLRHEGKLINIIDKLHAISLHIYTQCIIRERWRKGCDRRRKNSRFFC
jgi:hypothetical protein